ncbi:MAG: hypothetical protein Q4G26_09690 [Paracoccus sp. (in: a-proteobacteria)]|nr:hypothetical protein [Paracoccus sp. (in: a-proteobacteria)]
MTTQNGAQNSGSMVLAGDLGGDLANTGVLVVAQTGDVSGKLTNSGNAQLASTGTLGALDNSSSQTANVTGTILGAVTNSGTMAVNGDLVTGRDQSSGKTLTNSGRINLNGTLTGRVDNSGTIAMANDSAITGSLNILEHGRLELTGATTITGNLDNNGTIFGNSTLTTLTSTGGVFYNNGLLDAVAGGRLQIIADLFDLGDDSSYDSDNVALIGTIANSGIINYNADAQLTGGIYNRATGRITVSAAIDVASFDVTNEGRNGGHITVTGTGSLSNVTNLTNRGDFFIQTGGSVTAVNTVNEAEGVLNIGGTLTTALENQQGGEVRLAGGTVIGNVGNAGLLTGSGRIEGELSNTGDLRIENGQTLVATALVLNHNQATLGGTLSGSMRNTDGATLTMAGGTITGSLNNLGTMTGGGRIIGQFNNNNSLDIGAGDTLTVDRQMNNRANMSVAGTLNGAVNNEAIIEGEVARIELEGGTITGNVRNAGRLTGTGNLQGVLTNDSVARFAGSANVILNNATLASTGDLDITRLTNAGTAVIGAGTRVTVTETVTNSNRLNVSGTLEASVINEADATTAMQGGEIIGTVDNIGTLFGPGTITGRLNNTGRINVHEGHVLTGTDIVNSNVMNVVGTLNGQVHNTADSLIRLNGGTIGARIINEGNLNGSGRITGHLTNSGVANLNGSLYQVVNSGQLTATGDLDAAGILNSGALNLGGYTLASTGLTNQLHGVLAMQAGTVRGSVTNIGTISGPGTITGALINEGGLLKLEGGRLSTGQLVNNAALSIDAGDTLASATTGINHGSLALGGVLEGDLLNNAQLALAGGAITGAVQNAQGATISGEGRIDGTLLNEGTSTQTGTAGHVRNEGSFDPAGQLSVAGLDNLGELTVRNGARLNAATAVQNARLARVGGTLDGALVNHDGAETVLEGGTLTSHLFNAGDLTGSGRIDGSLQNQGGDADVTVDVGGDLINLGGGITLQGASTVTGRILNSASDTLILNRSATVLAAGNPGVITIATGSTTTANGAVNGPNAGLVVDGTLASDVLNNGRLSVGGRITGDISNTATLVSNGVIQGTISTGITDQGLFEDASASIDGRVIGNVIYGAGQLSLGDGLEITETLDLRHDFGLAEGRQVRAGRTQIHNDITLTLGGTVTGAVVNAGRIHASNDTGRIAGNLDNFGTVDLGDGGTDTVLTVQGLSGNGVLLLDVSTGEELLGDRVVVSGGATTGRVHLSFNELPTTGGATVGKRLTLLEVDRSFGAANNYTYSADDLTAASERIVYSIDQSGPNGDLQLVSQINPAIGAMFANVTLVQSLIGSVINRPTSPYVTGLVTPYGENPCGVGGWGRATGGHATVEGKTDNQISVLQNRVSANYYGMQGGMDMVCFDDRFGGWNMSVGVLGGINIGDTRQPIYAINSQNSQVSTDRLASITTSDFKQTYGGLYMTGTKGRWSADIQVRGEKTDFELKNTPVTGSGLLISDPDFSSQGYTVSGSLAYSMPVQESGWIVTPNIGFSWSKFKTDSITFDGDFTLEFDDSTREIGFIGASVGKTFIREHENAAIHAFATATYFHDFADNAASRLLNPTLDGYETQILTSENLKNYGEVSIGANYIKVLNPSRSGRPRQFSTSARIDGRFGDTIESVGVTGQFRLQF